MTANILNFDNEAIETSKATGTIATIDWDLDITLVPNEGSKSNSPTHRIVAKSPRGHDIECGAVWKKQNKETGADYFSLNIRGRNFNANLGQAAGQDDPAVQAIIPWN